MAEQHNFRVAILGSGDLETGEGGSTMYEFIRAANLGIIAVEIGLVICNNSQRRVPGFYQKIEILNREFGLDIQTLTINRTRYPAAGTEVVENGTQTLAEGEACAAAIAESGADLFLQAGFMKKVVGDMLNLDGLNTHPGPLPLTKGLHGIDVQQKVIDEEFPFSAHTVHKVVKEYDAGEIIAWRPVLVKPGENAVELFKRVQIVEKACLPQDVERYLETREAA